MAYDLGLLELLSKNIKDTSIESLVDIETINIDKLLSEEERLSYYIDKIKNPYLFKCGKIKISIGFSETNHTLRDLLLKYYIRSNM